MFPGCGIFWTIPAKKRTSDLGNLITRFNSERKSARSGAIFALILVHSTQILYPSFFQ